MLSLNFTFVLLLTNTCITLSNLYQWNCVPFAVSEVCLRLKKTVLISKLVETKQQIVILNGIFRNLNFCCKRNFFWQITKNKQKGNISLNSQSQNIY